MLFEINNIGKIRKAKIEMKGITVIAGDNNTGKRTYGKVLYCMFNAFCNANAAIHIERMRNIEDFIFSFFRPYPRSGNQFKNLLNNIIDHQSSSEEIRALLEGAINDKS